MHTCTLTQKVYLVFCIFKDTNTCSHVRYVHHKSIICHWAVSIYSFLICWQYSVLHLCLVFCQWCTQNPKHVEVYTKWKIEKQRWYGKKKKCCLCIVTICFITVLTCKETGKTLSFSFVCRLIRRDKRTGSLAVDKLILTLFISSQTFRVQVICIIKRTVLFAVIVLQEERFPLLS